jgi:hypothetical protein
LTVLTGFMTAFISIKSLSVPLSLADGATAQNHTPLARIAAPRIR